jgi:mannose/cellobiose epimerase-like protein (N-acyl-D-glucosamine 2-epimerase family)
MLGVIAGVAAAVSGRAINSKLSLIAMCPSVQRVFAASTNVLTVTQLRPTSDERVAIDLASTHHALRAWLATYAYEVWWTRGADQVRGGFHERLNLDATPTDEPRRARLHPRQVFAYAHATAFGWPGPAREAVQHGLNFFVTRYKRDDGFYRTKVAPDGTSVDDRIELYDQAFALLGFASAYASTGEPRWQTEAYALHDCLRKHLLRTGGGFNESIPTRFPLSSNSHMHLLESALAWIDIDTDPRWRTLATQIVELALERWIDRRSGAIGEYFGIDWQPAHTARSLVEPGHQFEWASLLLHFSAHSADTRLKPAALRLIDFGETWGVDPERRAAMNSCWVDGRREDAEARLWPQTERIKASCRAAEVTGASIYSAYALEATQTLMRYFDTPVSGLWRDCLNEADRFREEPAPASSFYHIVGAAIALDRLHALPGIDAG